METYDNYTFITNVSDETRDASVIVAEYDDGALTNVYIEEITVEAWGFYEIAHHENARVFVWDSLEKMHPINL